MIETGKHKIRQYIATVNFNSNHALTLKMSAKYAGTNVFTNHLHNLWLTIWFRCDILYSR